MKLIRDSSENRFSLLITAIIFESGNKSILNRLDPELKSEVEIQLLTLKEMDSNLAKILARDILIECKTTQD